MCALCFSISTKIPVIVFTVLVVVMVVKVPLIPEQYPIGEGKREEGRREKG